MVLTAKQTGTIHSMTGSDKDELKALYDDGHLNTLSEMKDSHPELAALAYQIQNISNDIDALRQFSGSEEKGRIDANATNITVANGNITTNAADIRTNATNISRNTLKIPPLTINIAIGLLLSIQVRMVPPAKGQKKGTAILVWTLDDTVNRVAYNGTQTLI